MHEIELNRNSHLIDPHLHLWGWEVSVYLFLGGLAAGIMVFCALLVLRRGMEDRSAGSRWVAFLAPLILSLGMLTLLMDLEYKFHVWRFYAAFKITSPMSWGSWILLLIYPATLAIGLATLTAPFWTLVVIAGLAVPLTLETIEIVKQRRPTVWAPLLLLIGGLALRFIIVAAGQA